MGIEVLTDPEWVGVGQVAINCKVKFFGLDSAIPFTASASDTSLHGRQLYVDLIAGKYGEIAPFIPDTELLRSDKKTELTDSYNAACQVPVEFTTAGGVTQMFQADTGSQQLVQQSLAGLAGAQATPPDFAWLAMDNTPVPFTWADLQGLARAMYLQGYQAFVRLQQKKALLAVANTADDISAVRW